MGGLCFLDVVCLDPRQKLTQAPQEVDYFGQDVLHCQPTGGNDMMPCHHLIILYSEMKSYTSH